MHCNRYLFCFFLSLGGLSAADDGVGIREPLHPFAPHSASNPALTVPEARSGELNHSSIETPSQLWIEHIQLHGNSVFNSDELNHITRRYEKRLLYAHDLQQLRHELTLFYIQKGYINSGAVIPQQQINAGQLHIDITEGRLISVEIEGLNHLQPFYLTDRITRHSENTALNVQSLQQDLQLIQQNPLIEQINAELKPGTRPGEALLKARVLEANPWYLSLGGNNLGVANVGAERLEIWGGHRDVLGLGDGFDGHFNISEGQNQYDFHYTLPFNRWDSRITMRYQHSDAKVIASQFKNIHVYNQIEALSLGLTQPLWQTLKNEVNLSLNLEHRYSRSFLLDDAYSFAEGAVNGMSRVNVLRFGQDWLHRTNTQVLAARSVISLGLDAWDATVHHDGKPDGRYLAWLGQMQWVQKLFDTGAELHWRGDAQLVSNRLLALEQFALGGMYSVRGYRQNQWVRDEGFATSLELRIPMPHLAWLKLAPFFDYGRAWNSVEKKAEADTLSSTGIGLLVDPFPRLHGELYWAHALQQVTNDKQNLQDSGIHFAVRYDFF